MPRPRRHSHRMSGCRSMSTRSHGSFLPRIHPPRSNRSIREAAEAAPVVEVALAAEQVEAAEKPAEVVPRAAPAARARPAPAEKPAAPAQPVQLPTRAAEP